MKFSEISKRLGVALLTGAVVVSIAGMNVSADETGAIAVEKVDITKNVTTDGNTYKPNTTFEFNVASGEAATDFEGSVVYAGVEGGLRVTKQAIFKPAQEDKVSGLYTEKGELSVDVNVFDIPGVYHYVVSETKGSYEGIKYDQSSYDVYVYVYKDANGGKYVGNVISVKDGEIAKEDGIVFTNDYGKDDDNDSTHDVTIQKNITGNQANMSAKYNFDVTINGQDSGEYYKVVVKETADSEEVVYAVASGSKQAYTIGHDGTIKIYGLSESDTYTVTEQEANTDGYTLTVTEDGKTTATVSKTNGKDTGINGTVAEDGAQVTFTNNKDVTAPTGVIMNIAPYALMVALAGVLAFFFLRRRHSEI